MTDVKHEAQIYALTAAVIKTVNNSTKALFLELEDNEVATIITVALATACGHLFGMFKSGLILPENMDSIIKVFDESLLTNLNNTYNSWGKQ